MPTTRLSAEEIAEQQLLSALRLWQDEEYVSAITLAGAAEEILGKRLRSCGKESSFDNIKKAMLKIAQHLGDDEPKTERMVASLFNLNRNALKHYSGDEAIELDRKEDSVELLERAITNYQILTGMVHDEMLKFWGAVDGT